MPITMKLSAMNNALNISIIRSWNALFTIVSSKKPIPLPSIENLNIVILLKFLRKYVDINMYTSIMKYINDMKYPTYAGSPTRLSMYNENTGIDIVPANEYMNEISTTNPAPLVGRLYLLFSII